MRRLELARIVVSLLLLAPAASAKELWQYDWIEVRTPHFVIASAMDEKRSVELALDLESFRYGAERVTNIGRFEERIPTRVYALPRLAKELGVDGVAVGIFMPAMRANYALITPQGEQSDEVLKHEYMHFLIHNRDSLVYPPWFDEGLAELLSTLRVTENGTRLEYGNSMRWRVESLAYGSWISFDTVLETRDTRSLGRNRGGMFYAQAWLLMHYLVIGREGRNFAVDTAKYLAATEAGTPTGEAFEAAYGLAPDAIARTLRSYWSKARYFRTRLKEPFPQAQASVRALRADEVAAQLGLIAITRGDVKAASEYFDAALAANPDNALALIGSGDVDKHAQRYDAAVAKYERAIALEPGNANHELDYGEYFVSRAVAEESDAAQRAAFITEARRHFARSYKLNPDNPETLDQNGLTYVIAGDDPAKGVASLEVAHQLLPSQPQIRANLAWAYIQADQPAKARPHLTRLLAWAHSSSAERIQELLAQAEAAEAKAHADAGAAADTGASDAKE